MIALFLFLFFHFFHWQHSVAFQVFGKHKQSRIPTLHSSVWWILPTCVVQDQESKCVLLFLLICLHLRKPNLLNNSQLKENTEGGDAAKEGETIRCIVFCQHMVEPVRARFVGKQQ